MAMTKQERDLLEQARRQAAFRRTMPIERDVQPPDASSSVSALVVGWDFNTHAMKVWQGWSSSVAHGDGTKEDAQKRHRSATQGARSMFSTKVLALRAMRWDLEERTARDLRDIDRMIEQAIEDEQGAAT